MLDRIGAREPDDLLIARKTLMWLICCTRPLNLNELGIALAISPNDKELNEDERLDFDEQLLEICGSMIKLNQDFLVELGHFSVREYLTAKELSNGEPNPHFINEMEGHQLVLESCLSYLSFTLYKDGLDGEPIARDQQLLHYAVYQWYAHGRIVEERGGDVSSIISFLAYPPSLCFFAWCEIYYKPEHGPRPISWAVESRQFTDLGVMQGDSPPIHLGLHYAKKLGFRSNLTESFENPPQFQTSRVTISEDWEDRVRSQL